MRLRSPVPVLTAMVALGAPFALAGCSRHPRTAEDAYRRFSDAVNARDHAALFETLDQPTRWAWMTVQKSHREATDIILSNYPEAVRDRELRRFEKGAAAANAVELFKAEEGEGLWPMLTPLVMHNPRIQVDGDHAEVLLASAARVPFRHGEDGSWGFAGFAARAEDRKALAIHALEEVRTSAADYERAAARGGR